MEKGGTDGHLGWSRVHEQGQLAREENKKGYKIEMCFLYPKEDEENRSMW